ncbi:MAG: hypothetical protein EB084_04600 [Proteobacteria bacterium]|nr:hypothetical protein [Pseudomonadota bacterium]
MTRDTSSFFTISGAMTEASSRRALISSSSRGITGRGGAPVRRVSSRLPKASHSSENALARDDWRYSLSLASSVLLTRLFL